MKAVRYYDKEDIRVEQVAGEQQQAAASCERAREGRLEPGQRTLAADEARAGTVAVIINGDQKLEVVMDPDVKMKTVLDLPQAAYHRARSRRQ